MNPNPSPLPDSTAAWNLQRASLQARLQLTAPRLIAREGKKLARARAQAARLDAILLHVAGRYNAIHGFTSPGRATNTWHIGTGYAGDSEWYNYKGRAGRQRKWEPGSNGVQQIADGSIELSNTRGKTATLPPIPRALLKHIDLEAPHPVGLFPVPIKNQPGVFACFDARRGEPFQAGPHPDGGHYWSPTQRWVVTGFCVAGHRVPECVARGTTTLSDIQSETNTESRRIMIERFGIDRWVRESGLAKIQSDDFGDLYDGPGVRLARLLNSTPEPDGSRREYWLPVPASCQSAHAAVAWSFGLRPAEYQPAIQT